jgi:hypothetical protein
VRGELVLGAQDVQEQILFAGDVVRVAEQLRVFSDVMQQHHAGRQQE